MTTLSLPHLEQRRQRLMRDLAETDRAMRTQIAEMLATLDGLGPVNGTPTKRQRRGAGRAVRSQKKRVRRLHCPAPKCDRTFSHPLPMARHMAATHGKKRKK